MPGACLGINVGATLANGELTLIALPGRGAFQVRPLGATSDGSELSQGLTLRYLATTNGGSEKIPPCRTNRQGIAKGSLPDTSTVLCPSCAGHPPFTCREFFLHVPVRVCNDFALPLWRTEEASADLQHLIRLNAICRQRPSARHHIKAAPVSLVRCLKGAPHQPKYGTFTFRGKNQGNTTHTDA